MLTIFGTAGVGLALGVLFAQTFRWSLLRGAVWGVLFGLVFGAFATAVLAVSAEHGPALLGQTSALGHRQRT